MAKKKSILNPTMKAGIIILFVMGLMWMVLSSEDAWYMRPKDKEEIESSVKVVENKDDVQEENTTKNEIKDEPIEEIEVIEETDKEEETSVIKPEDIMANNFDITRDLNDFSSKEISWSFKRNTEHKPTTGYNEGVDLAFFDAFYIVPTANKVIYMTFDEGYENGYTASILDSLKENDVQAAFFVTASYIKNNVDLVKRMKEEGHIVGNHSVHHKNTPRLTYDETVSELKEVEEIMKTYTGYSLDLFFRPPYGTFSERSLYITRQQSYKSIFWSMAYGDWDTENQPGQDVAYNHVISNVHPGAIILLHAVSKSNTEAMDDILKELHNQGYRMGSLYEIESLYK